MTPGNGQSRRPEQMAIPSTFGQVPPHNLEAEAAVLSAMLLHTEALYLGLERLSGEHFYSDANRLIFEAAAACAAAVPPKVDTVTVAAQLRDWQVIQKAGGVGYIAQICDATPAVQHVDKHADIVRDKWRLRSLIASCHRIAAEGYGDTGPIPEFIEQAEQQIYELARSPEQSEPELIGEILIRDFRKIAEAAERGEGITGVSTGYRDLDKSTAGLHDSELLIVAGRPGMGKTALVLNIAANIASGPEAYGAAVFSLEMDKEQVSRRAAVAEARVDASRLRQGTLGPDDWTRLTAAGAMIGQLPLWIDDQPALTLMQLRGKLRRLLAQAKQRRDKDGPAPLKLVVIVDYLTLMNGSRQRGDSREQEVSNLSRGLKAIAKEFAIPVVVVAQLNRAVEARGGDKRPIMSDLRDSGAIEQDADGIVFVYREEYYKPDAVTVKGLAELLIRKQRHGPIGTVRLRYNARCTRFDTLAASEDYYGDDDGY